DAGERWSLASRGRSSRRAAEDGEQEQEEEDEKDEEAEVEEAAERERGIGSACAPVTMTARPPRSAASVATT
ncbi:hypothetical protein GOODEAATRI_032110, partial [Goodea atripinnis]